MQVLSERALCVLASTRLQVWECGRALVPRRSDSLTWGATYYCDVVSMYVDVVSGTRYDRAFAMWLVRVSGALLTCQRTCKLLRSSHAVFTREQECTCNVGARAIL